MGKGLMCGDTSNLARKGKKAWVGDATGKARKVKKIWVGDANNIARLCYSGAGEIKYVQQLTTNIAKTRLGFPVGNYAVFISGITTSTSSYMNAVDSSLTVTKTDTTYARGEMAGASLGDMAIIYGGHKSSSDSYATSGEIRTIDSSLTHAIIVTWGYTATQCGCTALNDGLVISGGHTDKYDGDSDSQYVYHINRSGTRTSWNDLRYPAMSQKAATLNDYAFFVGGYTAINGTNYGTYADAYNSSGTRTALSNCLNSSDWANGIATTPSYVLVTNNASSNSASVTVYNKSLTKMSNVTLTEARRRISGASIGEYAMFVGGQSGYTSTYFTTVDLVDDSLTVSVGEALPTATYLITSSIIGNSNLIVIGPGNEAAYKAAIYKYE